MQPRILPYFSPSIGPEEIAEVVDTLQSNWLTTGPKTKEFEKQFASQIGSREAIALSSCTAGLHLSLVCLDIGPGDEVITTPLTFAATANVIEHVGARPVFADVDPSTLNIDAEQIERAITPRTKAILPVHYAGHPVDLDAIQDIADRHGLTVVEDAAHAVGAAYKGRQIGTGNNPTSFSFYATKNLTSAEGGMLTGPPEILDRARVLSLHGLSRDAWKRYQRPGSAVYDLEEPGYKYNMTDVHASIGLCQLKKLEAFQQRRLEIAEAYNREFQNYPELEIPVTLPGIDHAWHLYVLRFRHTDLTIGRDEIVEKLTENGIGTSVHFTPIHMFRYYREKYGYRPSDYPIARGNFERMVSLPLHPALSDEDVADITGAVCSIVRQYRKRLAA